MNLSDYILLPRNERTAHIDLNDPCQFNSSSRYRQCLLDYLGIEIDLDAVERRKVYACHLCANDSWCDPCCCNPKHMYLGTPTENRFDSREIHKVRRKATKAKKKEERFLKRLKEHDEIAWRLWVYGTTDEIELTSW